MQSVLMVPVAVTVNDCAYIEVIQKKMTKIVTNLFIIKHTKMAQSAQFIRKTDEFFKSAANLQKKIIYK